MGFALLALALVGVGLFWLRRNLDGLVRDAIITHGSAMTQAKVRVGSVSIRAGQGMGTICKVRIGNPPGFKTKHALSVAQIELSLDVASLARDVVIIRKLAIHAPDVVYEQGKAMTNFDAIHNHISAYAGSPRKTKTGGGKRLIVEELTVRGATARVSSATLLGQTVSLALPDFSLYNLGKDKGGILPGELGKEIVQALKQKLAASMGVHALATSVAQVLDKANSAVKGRSIHRVDDPPGNGA